MGASFIVLLILSLYEHFTSNQYKFSLKSFGLIGLNTTQTLGMFMMLLIITYSVFSLIQSLLSKQIFNFILQSIFSSMLIFTSIRFLNTTSKIDLGTIWMNRPNDIATTLLSLGINMFPFLIFVQTFISGWLLVNLIFNVHTNDFLNSERIGIKLLCACAFLVNLYLINYLIPFYPGI